MGKIRVGDLATKIGVAEQDLVFKLKSIGVRVEGDEALIDTEVIQAILQGKQMPQTPQREVIMRDKGTPPVPAASRRRPRRTPPPPGPMRPGRRRTVVNRADPKIKTIQGKKTKKEAEKPATPEEVAAREVAAEEAARTTESTATETAAEAATEAAPSTDETTVAEPPIAPKTAADAAESELESRSATRKQTQEGEDELRPGEGQAIVISEGMTLRELADKLDLKSKDLIKHLISKGVMASVNQALAPETAKGIAEDLGYQAVLLTFEEDVQRQHEIASEKDQSQGTEPRAPIVTVMGHVNHGKTSLLDAIRKSSVAESESGGITQHIAAYQVDLDGGSSIVFLDTPGHEAFTQLRARGAKVTDIVVLVVAVDDGVMPQTVEAIQHAQAANAPIIVALNKVDRESANPERIKKQLSENNLLVEDWGGDIVAVPVSALKGQGIDNLLEMILLSAELLELKADPTLPAQGVIIEAKKEAGRGTVATVMVQNGTLEIGQAFVAGATWGRVRSMADDRGNRLESAGPATPVEVAGFNDLPDPGDPFQVVAKEASARNIADLRSEERRQQKLAPSAGRLSLESLFSRIKEGEVKELPVILKADVQGSVEVLRETLAKLSTDKVRVRVIGAGVGAISTNDVIFASASNAIIYGFNVRPERKATELANREGVDVRTHTVIYDLTDELKQAMAGLLDPEYQEVGQGRAEVREIFKVPRIGMIAGCHVVEGVIPRSASIRLLRDNVVIHEGNIGSLRRFKDDAAEVRSGFDCGIGIDQFQDIKPGDLIEAFTQEAITPTL